ncbi:hypothetical protein PGT21_002631 [Puccinia graminis f. sp. tritici]|uniref:Uncharacterized protein n=1 Tax=Puccinia graminis f. sp. tritici TaxID=56615 RepID=A0A5B0QSE2_PUCGR|nr:hypothetical protein PGT21_002631 [Puccinia graminis f. sp. tritici]
MERHGEPLVRCPRRTTIHLLGPPLSLTFLLHGLRDLFTSLAPRHFFNNPLVLLPRVHVWFMNTNTKSFCVQLEMFSASKSASSQPSFRLEKLFGESVQNDLTTFLDRENALTTLFAEN